MKHLRRCSKPWRRRLSLNEYGRFDDLRGTINSQRAKAYFDRIEGKSLPMFKVNIKAAKFLSDFLIRGVLSLNGVELDGPDSARSD